MASKLVVWGASGHARVVAEIIRLRGDYEIVGFLDDFNPRRHNEEFCGSIIIGGREQLGLLGRTGVKHVILGFGDCRARLALSELVRLKGLRLATAVHPRATIAGDVEIGPGAVVAAGAVVNPASRIGQSTIVNTSAVVEHEAVVEDGCHIGPGARLGARVMVGPGTFVGMGATVNSGVRLGAGAVIGAGALVLRDVPDEVVAYGVPARVRAKSDA